MKQQILLVLFRQAVLFLAAGCLAVSCSDDVPPLPSGHDGGEGTVLVDPVSTGVYLPTIGTRSDVPETGNDKLRPLEDGTTLWIVVFSELALHNNQPSQGKNSPPEKFDDPQHYAYKVVNFTDENGEVHTSLSSLRVNNNNGDYTVSDEPGSPMYLKKGYWYMFQVISPAYPLVSGNGMWIDNGQYLLANDDDYEGTQATRLFIGDDASEVDVDSNGGAPIFKAKLNPIINQTSQIRVTLEAGNNTYRIDAMPHCVTISGLQTPQEDKDARYKVNWTIQDSNFKTYAGHHDASLLIEGKDMWQSDDKKRITGSAAVLPSNNFSSPILLTFTVLVDFTVVQQQCILSGQEFKPGFSYHYVIKLHSRDGIIVNDWALVSWSHDLVLENKP